MSRRLVFTIFCFVLGASFAQEANARTLTVTRADDRNGTCNSGVDCSLREAIKLARNITENITIEFSTVFNSPQTIVLGSPLVILQTVAGAITINGKGAHLLTISGNNQGQVFEVSQTTLTLRGLTVTGGSNSGITHSSGSLSIYQCVITGNTGATAGGINAASISFLLADSTVSNNRSTSLDIDQAHTAGLSGGILLSGGSGSIINSTISGNINISTHNDNAGGIYFDGGAEKVIRNSTITKNSAAGAGGVYLARVTMSTYNTIIAENSNVNSANVLVGFASIFNPHTSLIGGDPKLYPLANNGGTTPTHALRCDSPALNGGNPATAEALDQRGVARPADGVPDIGAYEANIFVTNANSSGAGSLLDTVSGAPAGGVVCFSPGYFNVPRTIPMTATLTISKNLTIGGMGADLTTIDGQNTLRLFQINSGFTFNLSGMRLYRGSASGGGGIFNAGTLNASNLSIESNTGTQNCGGVLTGSSGTTVIYNSTIFGNSTTGNGGGVCSGGYTVLNNSTVSGNTAGQNGGAVNVSSGARLDTTNTTISENNASQGGGIFIETNGTYLLRNAIIAGNTAGNSCPEVFGAMGSFGYNLIGNDACNSFYVPMGGNGDGNIVNPQGGARLHPLADNFGQTKTYALQFDSPARDMGDPNNSFTTDQRGAPRPAHGRGDIGAYELSVQTVTNFSDSGTGSFRQAVKNSLWGGTIVFPNPISAPQTIPLAGEILIDKSLTIIGPGADKLTVDAGNSGRIFNIGSGEELRLSGMRLYRGNAGLFLGGCVFNSGTFQTDNVTIDSCTAGAGGGIYSIAGKNVSLMNSTLSNNTATIGGGIYSEGWSILNNSTIAGNTATGQKGGGIYVAGGTNARVDTTNSTISGNNSGFWGGGVYVEHPTGGLYQPRNTIIAGNTSGDGCPDVSGEMDSFGYNLVGSNHCNSFVLPPSGGTLTGNLFGTPASPLDARLASLGNYGGTTQTMALLSDSPAIDAADPINPFNTDQRGSPRPYGGRGDIGAFEVQPQSAPTPTATPTPTPTPTPPPVAAPNPAVTNKDTPVTITFTGTDADNNDLTFEITDAPDFGTLGTISSPDCTPTNTCTATVAYTPNAGFGGADFFKFRAKDSTGNSPEVTVNITVISYVVTKIVDTDDGVCDADCSLREAIAAANAAAGPDLISVQVNGTLSLTSAAPLIITGDTIIHGNNAEVTRHHANDRIFSINAPATVTINNLVMRDGVSPGGNGGGLLVNGGATLNLNDSTVTSSRARHAGGGIYSGGTLHIRRSTISENISNYAQTSVGDGGGIFQIGRVFTMTDSTVRNNRTQTDNDNCPTGSENCFKSAGGGIYLSRATTDTTAVIENSTVSGNTAKVTGGGIHSTGTILQMSNVTVSGNTGQRGDGGGLFVPFGGPATLRNCTFADNSGFVGGGLANRGPATSIENTIFANNTSTRFSGPRGPEIYNENGLTYAGRNLIVGAVFGTTPPADTITTNPNLLPLGFYGGHTPTRALPPDSSAINAAVTLADTPSTDQRGFPRAGAVDIGAFEAQPNNLPAASATPNPATTNDDTPIQITLTGTDPEGDDLTFHITDAPNSGTLGMISTPDCTPTNTCTATVTYTPNANFNDGDSFSFKVNDGLQDSTDAPVQIWVTAVNSAPIITEGTSVSVTMSEDGSPTAFSLTLNATNTENETLTWSISTPAANGGAAASGTGASKTIDYTPNANFNGSDSFVVRVTDEAGGTDTITVQVNVQPVNDAPVITEGASASVTMSEDGSPTPFSLTLNATDVDTGTTLTWSIGTSAAHGTASATGTGMSKAIGYVPNANFNGTDSFVVNVSDGNSGSDSITVNVTVNAQNDTPTTSSIPDVNVIQGASNTTIMLQDYFADVEDSNGSLTYSVQGNTNPGLFTSVTIGAGNVLTLDYNPSAFGSSNITIRATDTGGLFVDDALTVTVIGRPTVSKAFSPAVIPVNGTSTATITLGNPNSIALTISGTFTDNLPANVTTVAATAANTCSGTATQTSTSVSLTGGTIPAGGSCTLAVSVTSSTPGTHTNTIAAGDLVTTNAGSNLLGATANLNVAASPTVAKSFAPNAILTGDSSTVTITLSNSNAFALTNAAIIDTMPANVTTLAGTAATTCAGGTATQTSGSVSLSGGTIPANGNCTLTVNVTSLAAGTYVNSIAAGDLTTSGGPNTAGTSAGLDVTCLTGPLTVTSNADEGPGTLRRAVRQVCSPGVINFDMTSLVSPIDLSNGQITIDKNVTIQGPGANVLTVRNTAGQGPASRVFFITAGVTAAEISELTISGGNIRVGRFGEAAGGGILIDGTLALMRSTVSGNTGNIGAGGGIAVQNSGVLNLTDSTLSGNTARNGGGLLVSNVASATVTNSTISGNLSLGSAGAGIRVVGTGTLLLQNSTVTDNTATNGPGGVRKESGTGSATIRSSIIAGNQNSGPEVLDVDGVFTSQGYNLIGGCPGGNCAAAGFTGEADQTGTTDPQLDALADNGGPTQTHALQPGSPAIDKGQSSGSSTDQRGLIRPVDDASIANATAGDGSDIGAFEVQPNPAPVLTYQDQTVAFNGSLTINPSTGPSDNGGLASIAVQSTGTYTGTISVNNTTGVVSVGNAAPVGAHTITIRTTDNSGATTDASFTLTVNKGDQSITFGALSNKTFGDPDFTVSATASSGLTVSFAASGQCTVTGNTVHLTDAGSCTITASQAGDGNYNAATPVDQTFTINKAAATVTLGSLSQTYDGTAKSATATTNPAGKTVVFSYSENGQPVASPTNAGSYDVSATINDANYQGSTTGTLVIGKANQTITFGVLSDKTYGSADFTVTATSNSGLAVSLAATGNCTVTSNSPGSVHLGGVGSCTITASQAGDSNYNAATPVGQSFNITKANQTITFGALAVKTFGNADFTVSATASSGLSVSFAASGQCTVTGNTVHLTGAGSCTITASQAGDGNYNAAAAVPQNFNIAKANQTITFGALANKTFGSADFVVSATASSGLGVSFAASGQCSVSGNSIHLTGVGSCTITASQGGDANYEPANDVARPFSIVEANQTITFLPNPLPNRTFGDPDFTVTATASSGLAVTFTPTGKCTMIGNTVHLTGGGSCTITARQAGDANFNAAADVARPFSIAGANQTITFGALTDRTFGDSDFDLTATATSGLSVNFTAAGSCIVLGSTVHLTGAGSCTITASQGGNSNYNPAAVVQQGFNIAKADQTMTFAAVANKVWGDPDFSVSATATSSLAVSLTATGNCTVTAISPGTVHLTDVGSCTITASQAGNSNFKAATDVAQSFQISVSAPVAYDDSYFTFKDAPMDIAAPGVLSNDTATPGTTAVPISNGATAAGGTVTLNPDGSFSYTPASAYSGTDSFTYTATNASGSGMAKVELTVTDRSTIGLMISRFRFNGPNGATDEFVEVFNPSPTAHKVGTTSISINTGYGVFASAGNGTTSDLISLVCQIPNGTVIGARSYFLCTGAGYSLGNLGRNGGSAGATAVGDAPVGCDGGCSADIPNDAGLALINSTGEVNSTETGFSAGGPGSIIVFDKLGFAPYGPTAPAPAYPSVAGNFCEAGACLKPVGDASLPGTCTDSTGLLPTIAANPTCYGQSGQYELLRRQTSFDASLGSQHQDTNNNADDFIFISPNPGTNTGLTITGIAGVTAILGAAAPHNSTAPPDTPTSKLSRTPFDGTDQMGPRNAERNYSHDPTVANPANDPMGTFVLRFRYTNNSGAPINGVRFQVDNLSTVCGAQMANPGVGSGSVRNLASSPTCGGSSWTSILKVLNSAAEAIVDSGGTAQTVNGTVLEDLSVALPTPVPGPLSPMGGGIDNVLVVNPSTAGASVGDGVTGGAGIFATTIGSTGSDRVLRIKVKFGVVKGGRFTLLIVPMAKTSPRP